MTMRMILITRPDKQNCIEVVSAELCIPPGACVVTSGETEGVGCTVPELPEGVDTKFGSFGVLNFSFTQFVVRGLLT